MKRKITLFIHFYDDAIYFANILYRPAIDISLTRCNEEDECNLYSIPFEVKIVKNSVATVIDTLAMWIGLWIYPLIKKHIRF